MSEFQKLELKDFAPNPFDAIGKDWMLITAKKGEKVNTMTASWGGMGVLWGHNVVYVFIRHSRYTKEFVDAADTFSLTFFDTDKYRKAMSYLGTVSGRDEDKITKAELTVKEEAGTPYFAEAKTVLLCKKLSCHFIAPEGFIDETIDGRWYADQDYHDMYVAEITQVLEKR